MHLVGDETLTLFSVKNLFTKQEALLKSWSYVVPYLDFLSGLEIEVAAAGSTLSTHGQNACLNKAVSYPFRRHIHVPNNDAYSKECLYLERNNTCWSFLCGFCTDLVPLPSSTKPFTNFFLPIISILYEVPITAAKNFAFCHVTFKILVHSIIQVKVWSILH